MKVSLFLCFAHNMHDPYRLHQTCPEINVIHLFCVQEDAQSGWMKMFLL